MIKYPTLEKAIEFYEQQANDFAWCEDYASYLQQLTDWLKELKAFRDFFKGIDTFRK